MQNIFYFTASLAMVAVFIVCIWSMWIFSKSVKLINRWMEAVPKWNDMVHDTKYLGEEVKLKLSKFILKILDKKGKKGKEVN